MPATVSHQAERSTAVTEMPDELRADVRLLGELLGQVIAEHGGDDLLADVERLRKAVIGARRKQVSVDEITAMVAEWPIDRAVQIARAFTCYFHLANLAEEHFRIRTLRVRDTGEEPLPESLAQAVQELGDDKVAELVEELRLHPVLTAHPTEARRRAVVTAIQRISGQLAAYNSSDRGAAERAETRRRLLEEIDLLWRTAQLRSTKLDPLDEVRTAMAAFDETLFRVVPQVYRALDAALGGGGGGTARPRARAFIRYGSWIGGDRDGNPNVTSKVTRDAVLIQAEHVLIALENATLRIGRSLTLTADYTPASARLRAVLSSALNDHPDVVSEMATRSPREPHRQWLMFVAARIAATRQRGLDLAYRSPEQLLADLRTAQDSLIEAGANRQAYGELQHLIWQVETFGFHLAELEIRQHSQVHAAALEDIAAGRTSERTEEVLATIRTIAWIQERFGVTACRRYVVSFTRSADDIAAVHALAAHALGDRAPRLDVVPLFESGADLAAAPAVLSGMLQIPAVQARLAEDRRLEVMLGYSDSAKELGPAAATLKLYEAQEALAAWSAEHDVPLTLFHGRGGALGRGGGPANRAVLAQAPGSVGGRFKVTEQGEVIFARYGHDAIARRHMEQVTSAVLLASTPSIEARTAEAAGRFRAVAERVAAASEKAYRLLTEAPGFPEWFSLVSPLEEIGSLRLGSRPARRGLGAPRSLDDLRAIPWVFAWAQTRVNLPGWYGLGSGLEAVISEAGMEELRAAYREWPLFASLLDNVEMSLAKTDRDIAARYLALGARDDFVEQVLTEYDLTRRLVLEITGHTRLLEDRKVLSRAVQLRDPYVDALSHLQLRALSTLRADEGLSEGERERLSTLLLLSVNGVAAGLQNTG